MIPFSLPERRYRELREAKGSFVLTRVISPNFLVPRAAVVHSFETLLRDTELSYDEEYALEISDLEAYCVYHEGVYHVGHIFFVPPGTLVTTRHRSVAFTKSPVKNPVMTTHWHNDNLVTLSDDKKNKGFVVAFTPEPVNKEDWK